MMDNIGLSPSSDCPKGNRCGGKPICSILQMICRQRKATRKALKSAGATGSLVTHKTLKSGLQSSGTAGCEATFVLTENSHKEITMGRRNTSRSKPLRQQAYERLRNMQAFGESKKQAMENGTDRDKIFSYSTYKTYWKHTKYFLAWLKDHYP